MEFAPRKDVWLSIVMWVSILMLAGAGVSPLIVGGAGVIGGTLLFVICFTIAGLMAWLWLGIHYELEAQGLTVKMGPIRKFIPYEHITQLEVVRSWLSSYATSNRRIEIRYGKYDSIHISPYKQELFLEELKKRTPRIAQL